MRFIPILLIAVLAFIAIIEGCLEGDCEHPERNEEPRDDGGKFFNFNGDNNKAGFVSEVTGVPNYKECKSDQDCRYEFNGKLIAASTANATIIPHRTKIGRPFRNQMFIGIMFNFLCINHFKATFRFVVF
ncbi:hypothetical protein GCK72_025165 [Caenorhabditis remanei]|uniref:Uncharacterized protein n=1 Tax=Caenorhabditis remanei TaxID=31234 RepID=A0A6A5G184_CAERE|nr:hypothetical protein GCK72_025165 [Caenorhabditis remanei]KAF1748698.1 hypothetical protein GCK72_025165 [Caenorhabditis remanei]